MSNELYRGHEYRVYAQDGGFGWCVYGGSDLHPIKSGGPERSRTAAEEAAMGFIDAKRKADRAA